MNRSTSVFRILGLKYKFNMLEMMKFVTENQYWSKEQIYDYQLRHLQNLINHVYLHVPFYRTYMQKEGILPDDFVQLSDLALFPVIDKGLVKKNRKEFIADNFSRFHPMLRSTGGTTGIPFEYYNDRISWGLNWATKIRAFTWGDYHLGRDRIAVLKGGSMYNGGQIDFHSRIWRWLQRNYSFNIMCMTDSKLADYARAMKKYRIRFIRGYPSAICTFANWVKKHNCALNIETVFTTAEMLLPQQRLLIEDVFSCKVIDTYGCGDGMGGASQCCLTDEYHVNIETSIMEVLNSDHTQTPPGETGEIVLTSLHDYAMPLIRYCPGDQAVPTEPNTKCVIKLPVLKKIVGRTSDIFQLPNGRMINGLSIPLESWSDRVSKFQIIHETESVIVIKLVITKIFTNQDKQDILALMDSIAGEGIDVKIDIVDEIAQTAAGKHKYIISKVKYEKN